MLKINIPALQLVTTILNLKSLEKNTPCKTPCLALANEEKEAFPQTNLLHALTQKCPDLGFAS